MEHSFEKDLSWADPHLETAVPAPRDELSFEQNYRIYGFLVGFERKGVQSLCLKKVEVPVLGASRCENVASCKMDH